MANCGMPLRLGREHRPRRTCSLCIARAQTFWWPGHSGPRPRADSSPSMQRVAQSTPKHETGDDRDDLRPKHPSVTLRQSPGSGGSSARAHWLAEARHAWRGAVFGDRTLGSARLGFEISRSGRLGGALAIYGTADDPPPPQNVDGANVASKLQGTAAASQHRQRLSSLRCWFNACSGVLDGARTTPRVGSSPAIRHRARLEYSRHAKSMYAVRLGRAERVEPNPANADPGACHVVASQQTSGLRRIFLGTMSTPGNGRRRCAAMGGTPANLERSLSSRAPPPSCLRNCAAPVA
jgi:hypothetical protein